MRSFSKIVEIEALRGIAVMMVVLTHLSSENILFLPFPFDSTGWGGVILFFVISGYVITSSMLRKFSVKEFYLRRFFRIVPLAVFWVITPILFSIVANTLGQGRFPALSEMIQDGIYALTFLYNYIEIAGHQGVFIYYWTLSVEEHFYLLFPLFWFLLKTNHQRLWGIISIIIFIGGFNLLGWMSFFKKSPLWFSHEHASQNRFDSIAVGVLLALAFSLGSRRFAFLEKSSLLKAISWTSLLGVDLSSQFFPKGPFFSLNFIFLTLFSAILVALASFDSDYFLPQGIIRKGLEFLGARSFSIYLAHWPCFKFIKSTAWEAIWNLPLPRYLNGLLAFGLIISFTLLFVEIGYRAVELPMIARGKKLILKSQKQLSPI